MAAIVGVLASDVGENRNETGVSQTGGGNARTAEARIAGTRSDSVRTESMNDKAIVERSFEAENPETWEAAVNGAQQHLREVSGALISVAKDEKRSDDDRRTAIFVLGTIDNKESLDFLIENITLVLPIDIGDTEEDRLKMTPCRYALMMGGSWKAGQAVMASLDAPKSKHERLLLATVLSMCLTKNVALAAVDQALVQLEQEPYRSAPGAAERRESLEVMKAQILD